MEYGLNVVGLCDETGCCFLLLLKLRYQTIRGAVFSVIYC